MCVIAICNNGKKLDRSSFGACFSSNDDGVGMAWIVNGLVGFAKGYMKEKKAWNAYNQICDYPHVIHFRLTSAGSVCPELTHPFLCTPESPITYRGIGKEGVLFHNGTVGGWHSMIMSIALANKKYPEGKMSDTRVMAMAVGIVGKDILKHESSKYCYVHPEGFVRYGDFTNEDGIWFSNSYWKHRKQSWKSQTFNNTYYGGFNSEDWGMTQQGVIFRKRFDKDEEKKEDGKRELPKELKGTVEVKLISGDTSKMETTKDKTDEDEITQEEIEEDLTTLHRNLQ